MSARSVREQKIQDARQARIDASVNRGKEFRDKLVQRQNTRERVMQNIGKSRESSGRAASGIGKLAETEARMRPSAPVSAPTVAANPATGVASKGMSRVGKIGVAAGAIGVAALGVRALRNRGQRRMESQGPPPTQYYQRGDVWPNQDPECGRIEYKAFNNPKQFV
jgi:hypothetical protein